MKFGFYLPTFGAAAEPEALARLVAAGEAAGFHSAVISDHIVVPTEIASKYPYTPDGVFRSGAESLEQLAMMAYVAAVSSSLRLVTSIMVLPHRNPVQTAKMLATIDVLSKGRVTVGVGVGWMREEFLALGRSEHEYRERGRLSDEYIELFKMLWTRDPAEFQGEFYSFEALHCRPFPVQKPHPPIWIGGHTRRALKRVVRHGDGWHPVGANDAVPLPPAELGAKVSELKQYCEAEGRDFDEIVLTFKARLYDERLPAYRHGERLAFSGSDEQVIEDVHAYRALGLDELIFDVRSPSLGQCLERLDHLNRDIIARIDD